MATIRQIEFLKVLLSEREHPWQGQEETLLERAPLTANRIVSGVIEDLKGMPFKVKRDGKKKDAEPRKDAEPGYYKRGDEVFVVVWNRAKTHTYGKQLVFSEAADGSMRPSWHYEPGAGSRLAADDLKPLTVEQAGALGHLHGYCIVCCRALTDPESVKRGIGPVCASRLSK